MRCGVYWARKVAVEMLCEMCDDERDFVASSGKGVYGGGEPRLDIELRGRTTGGDDGVKRKGWD